MDNEPFYAIIYAPWTDEQVESLNGYQTAGVFHPFTCAQREPDGTEHVLVATAEGWKCPMPSLYG